MGFQASSGSRVFISVVSHGHTKMIKEFRCLERLAEKFDVVIKNNKPDNVLSDFCEESKITLIDNDYGRGFGYNNNVIFNHCCSKLGMKDSDFFIVLNPDVIITNDSIVNLINKMSNHNVKAATINLYRDEELTIYDDSVRRFPGCMDFVKSFIFGVNNSKLDKAVIDNFIPVDWCAGSFMAFRASAFKMVRGFDINYFMYCEDVDLCLRLSKKDVGIIYFPEIKAVHKAKHDNRKVFSKHFWWHVKSILFFIRAKNGLLKSKSNLI
ncbi:glycosyltransferase family 2 protein [Erwinia aphidicola]|uniref:glycosyltransferase family 2 protein n=1 Tax=Erwinia aphidicola TaxID=68334 RepID=UPI003CE714EA